MGPGVGMTVLPPFHSPSLPPGCHPGSLCGESTLFPLLPPWLCCCVWWAPGRAGAEPSVVSHLLCRSESLSAPPPVPHAVWSLASAPPASGTTQCQGCGVCPEAPRAGTRPPAGSPAEPVLAGSGGSQGGVRGAGAPWGWRPGSLPAGRAPGDSAGMGSVVGSAGLSLTREGGGGRPLPTLGRICPP